MSTGNGDLDSILDQILRKLQAGTPGVLGSGVISADGFAIASDLPNTIEEQRVAAMAAAMLALGDQTTHEFEQGSLQRVFVEGETGHVLVVSAGPDALLSVIARKDAKLGLVFLQMQRAAEEIRQALCG